jgi:hypothetical protein
MPNLGDGEIFDGFRCGSDDELIIRFRPVNCYIGTI